MSLFRDTDEFFSALIDDEVGRFFFLNLPFWGALALITWGLVGLLAPYAVLLFFPLVFWPLFFSSILWAIYRETGEFKGFSIAVPIILGLYVLFIGVPGVKYGLLFEGLMSEPFSKFYVWSITRWWRFLNFINPLANDGIPGRFYVWPFLWGQLVFWFGGLIVIPYTLRNRYRLVEERREEHMRSYELKREVAQKAEENEVLRAKRAQESAKRVERERLEKEKCAREEQAKLKAATDKDPWGSGFL